MPHLPPGFIRSLRNLPGFNEIAFIQAHEAAESITSIRINPAKQQTTGNRQLATGNEQLTTVIPPHADNSKEFFENISLSTNYELNKSKIIIQKSEMVPWCNTGFYLSQRPAFTLHPLFHAGAYYVQEASSMFLEQALQQSVDLSQPLKVLDLCASPGGKSTHLQSLISPTSLLVSNEVIKARASVLTENITKWGAANVIITNNDPSHFQRLPHFFNVLIVDAPCSGSGLFRKDADAIDEWSEDNVQLCSQRQQRILADALPCLQAGGVLIYSTCSYSIDEDENILQWLVEQIGMESIRLQSNPEWNIIETTTANAYGYRFYPDKVKGEGLFIAAFKKPGITENDAISPPKIKLANAEKEAAIILKKWLKEDMAFVPEKEDWLAMPAFVAQCLPLLKKHLYLRKAGINMGRIIRQELVPHHELALSSAIDPNITSIEFNEEQALQYLRRQDITIEPPKNGWLLVTYQGMGLGWIKAIGSRINNYYPLEWRIRK